jgi:hypothetical protein
MRPVNPWAYIGSGTAGSRGWDRDRDRIRGQPAASVAPSAGHREAAPEGDPTFRI